MLARLFSSHEHCNTGHRGYRGHLRLVAYLEWLQENFPRMRGVNLEQNKLSRENGAILDQYDLISVCFLDHQ